MAERKEYITMTPTQYQLCEHLGVDPMEYARLKAEAGEFDRCPTCHKTLGTCNGFHGLSARARHGLIGAGITNVAELFVYLNSGKRIHKIPYIGAGSLEEILRWVIEILLDDLEGLRDEN